MYSSKVQHLNRSSSDELLRKFADLDSKPEPKSNKREPKVRTRRKRSRPDSDRDSPTRNGSLVVERKSLLPPTTGRSALLRQIGIGRPELRMREIVISRSLLKKIGKTWHKTVEGASKMFMEKHCNQHMRLRNEVI